MQLEFFTLVSYSTEFERAIFNDLPLTFMVAVIMVAFTCIVFFKPHRVQSRSLLGISSVYTITMSVFMGHGLMFLIGKSVGAMKIRWVAFLVIVFLLTPIFSNLVQAFLLRI